MVGISADKVIVELEAKLDRYNANVTNAQRHFDRSMSQIQGAAGRAERMVTTSFRAIAAAAGVVGVGAAVREFLRYVDTAKQIEAQLRLATRETGNFAQAQEDVRRIASETRSGLAETASLYATFQRNSRELGITQAQAARATETVTKAFQISGASAAEAAGGLRQFLQGVQSGTLRGEELNSVLENAPRLARLLADSLGVTIGQLRAMGQEGQLSGDKLIRALTDRRFTEQIDAEFRELPVTFDQAMTLVDNAATETFSAFDRGGRFSEAIVNFVTGGTEGMEDLARAAEESGADVRATFEGLDVAVFQPLLEGARYVFGEIGAEALSLRAQIAGLLGAFDDAYNGIFQEGEISLANYWMNGSVRVRRQDQSNRRGAFEAEANASMRQSGIDRTARALGGGARNGRSVGPQEFQRFINEPGRYDIFGNRIGGEPRPSRPTGGGTRRRRAGGRGESEETRARRQAREDESFDQEQRALQADLLAARQATTAAAEAVAAFEIQEIEAARDRQNAAYEAEAAQSRDRQDLARARAQQLIEANNAVAAERVRAVQLREEERIRQEAVDVASADLQNAMDLEQAQGALARTNEERRASALRLLGYQQELERLELEGIVASRDATDAQKEIARRRLEILDTLYQGQRQGVVDSTMGTRDRYLRDLREAGEDVGEQVDQALVSGLERANDQAGRLVAKFLGLKGIVGDVVADLARIAIRQAVLQLATSFGVPGFATGGSMILGGRAGRDANVLSLNGSPIARVGRGERMSITPAGRTASGPAASSRSQTIVSQTFVLDARHGITTPELLNHVNAVARREAIQAGAAAAQGTLKAVPARMGQHQRDGR